MSDTDSSTDQPTSLWRRLAASQIGRVSYGMLAAAVTLQLVTLIYTWPLWQSRQSPPNLPVSLILPDTSFGIWMIASLVVVLVHPRIGVAVHWVVLVAACLFDQFRLEPQFFGIAMLMIAPLGGGGTRVVRWYLVAMWLWAGLHKFISPDWFGHASWSLIEQAGWDAESLHVPFALLVAATEVLLGLLGWVRPSWAARICVAVHLGIVAFISPLVVGMNYSVIPWNLGVAVIGCWVLIGTASSDSRSWSAVPWWETSIAAVLLIMPAGFYPGWVDRSLCHVLYSDSLPRGAITTKKGVVGVRGWQELEVPFPSERRLFRLYFDRTAEVGDKLHISDPRPMLADQFFVMRQPGSVEIDADEFFRSEKGEVAGVGLDRRQSVFALARSGVTMMRESEGSAIYAVAFTPENFDPALLPYLEGLPNLEQIQLAHTSVCDEDLQQLKSLRMLSGLGLEHTKVTDEGLQALNELPYLDYVEATGSAIRSFRNN